MIGPSTPDQLADWQKMADIFGSREDVSPAAEAGPVADESFTVNLNSVPDPNFDRELEEVRQILGDSRS